MGYGMKYTKGGFPFKSPVKRLQVEDTEENVIQINDEGEDVEKENIESVNKDKLTPPISEGAGTVSASPDKQRKNISAFGSTLQEITGIGTGWKKEEV